jgi:hypothetical protein
VDNRAAKLSREANEGRDKGIAVLFMWSIPRARELSV